MKTFTILAALMGLLSISVQAQDKSEAKLTWLGHAAFQLVTRSGKVVLIDPWLTNPKAPKGFSPRKVDVILATHGHNDHVGEAFKLARKHKALFVASYELTEIAKTKGVKNIQPLNPQGSAEVAGLMVTAVNAVHSSSFQDGGKHVYAGAPLGFIVAEAGSPTLYHAGDTGVFGDMALIGETYRPDVALLPIGGVYTMKPAEAGRAAKLLRAKAIVPMHYGTFPALAGSPEALHKALDEADAPGKMRMLTVGTEVKLKELL